MLKIVCDMCGKDMIEYVEINAHKRYKSECMNLEHTTYDLCPACFRSIENKIHHIDPSDPLRKAPMPWED